MADLPLCSCGGEMYLDSFEHPKKPVEWLLRCQECGKFAAVASTPEESLSEWKKNDAGKS